MQSSPTCTSTLTFVNVDSGETTVISADVMPSPENITFDPAQLDTNSNYNVSVLASNVAGSAVSYTRISECCDYWVCVCVNIIYRCRNSVETDGTYCLHANMNYIHGV